MIPLFTKEEFNTAKSNDFLNLKCHYCDNIFQCQKKRIKHYIKENKYNRGNFCTKKCRSLYFNNSTIFTCINCGIEIIKPNSEIKKSNNHFCSQSCAAIYNNTHKTKGNRRSKLEIYLEGQLKLLYPDLEILFNNKDIINSELDIYIPSLKLAFELNGLFHYEPIFGENKLQQIQNNDNRKFQACLEQGIELCIIDTSQQKYFKEQTSKKYLNVIVNIIKNK
jgi:hypothetical protein